MPATETVPNGARQIKVWLGEHAFIDHIALDAASAASFEAAMKKRFAAASKITNEPADHAACLDPAAAGTAP